MKKINFSHDATEMKMQIFDHVFSVYDEDDEIICTITIEETAWADERRGDSTITDFEFEDEDFDEEMIFELFNVVDSEELCEALMGA